MSHDPDRKIKLPQGTQFKRVPIKTCLHKAYPQSGPYAGGIVFFRYLAVYQTLAPTLTMYPNTIRNYGVGEGIGYTKAECEKMWGELNLDDHIMLVHNDYTTSNPTTNASTTSTTTAGPTHAESTDKVQPGDCLEVWWEEFSEWYPCVVTDEAPDVGNTIASLCLYDDERKGRWHNLEVKYAQHT